MTLQEVIQVGMEHHQNGRFGEAESVYRRVLARLPDYHDAHQLMGTLAYQTGRFELAVQHLQRAVAVKGDVAHYHNNLGSAFMELGRLDEAIAAYQRALELDAGFADAERNLADALSNSERFEEAIGHYEKAQRLRPNWPDLLNNYGHALQALGRSSEAAERYRDALSYDPAFVPAHANLASVLLETGQIEAAMHSHRAAVRLGSDQPALYSNLLYAMHFDPKVDAKSLFDEHVNWGRAYAEPLGRDAAPHVNGRDANRRLKIGYVSADLRDHPVGRFMLPVLEHRDRERFEVHVFSDVMKEDRVTERAKQHVVFWYDTRRVSDADLANAIREKQIDILVDLAGHSAMNRLLVFARKAAPVQVTWLGYPDTTGIGAMGWRITDGVADSVGSERRCVERLMRLERFLGFDASGTAVSRPRLERANVTFGSFSNLAKVSSVTIEMWREILEAVPESKLVLKSQAIADESSRAEFLRRLGLPEGRVELLLKTATHREHLAAYADVDVALDTSPYNGTTTTCEALAMGVPVVTWAGEVHASRVGASILTHAGFGEWIAESAGDYVRIAKALAAERPAPSGVREKFLVSKVCDVKGFVKQLEAGYREMWADWVSR